MSFSLLIRFSSSHPSLRRRQTVASKEMFPFRGKKWNVHLSIISVRLLLWAMKGDKMYYSLLLLIKSIPIKIQIRFRENGTCWAQILIMGMISQQFLKLFIQEMGTYISQREYYMSPVTESPTKLSTTFLLFNTIKELMGYQYTSINTQKFHCVVNIYWNTEKDNRLAKNKNKKGDVFEWRIQSESLENKKYNNR